MTPFVFVAGGLLLWGIAKKLTKHTKPLALKMHYTLEHFRTVPIVYSGETGQFFGIDRVSYQSYKKAALAGIAELNKRQFSAMGVPTTDPVYISIVENVALMEYHEKQYGLKNLEKQ